MDADRAVKVPKSTQADLEGKSPAKNPAERN
jgi:hypothetical protein